MVLYKMFMEIALPKMGELLVMMMTMISPSGTEVPPAESLHWRAKVLLLKFLLGNVAIIQNFPTCHQDQSMSSSSNERERSAPIYPCRSRAEAFKRTGLRESYSS